MEAGSWWRISRQILCVKGLLRALLNTRLGGPWPRENLALWESEGEESSGAETS